MGAVECASTEVRQGRWRRSGGRWVVTDDLIESHTGWADSRRRIGGLSLDFTPACDGKGLKPESSEAYGYAGRGTAVNSVELRNRRRVARCQGVAVRRTPLADRRHRDRDAAASVGITAANGATDAAGAAGEAGAVVDELPREVVQPTIGAWYGPVLFNYRRRSPRATRPHRLQPLPIGRRSLRCISG